MEESKNIISLGFNLYAFQKEGDASMSYYLSNDNEYIYSEYEPFDNISVFERFGKDNSWEYYSIVSREDKYGAINKNGKICVPLDYDKRTLELILCTLPGVATQKNEICDGFYELSITPTENNKSGLSLSGVCDSFGYILLPVKYEYIKKLSATLLQVRAYVCDESTGKRDLVIGVTNIWGDEIIPLSTKATYYVSNGFILRFEYNILVSIFDSAGNLIKETNVEPYGIGDNKSVKVIYGRYLAIKYNHIFDYSLFRLYDFSGNEIELFSEGRLDDYIEIEEYERGLIKMKYYDGSIHLLTPSMQLIRTQYHKIGDFENGYAIVDGSGSKMGMIDKNFNETIELGEHSLERVSLDLCRITFKGNWSSTHCITCQGEMLLNEDRPYGNKLPAGVLSNLDFNNGICIVRKGMKFGLASTTGKIVLPVEYDSMFRLPNGLYKVSKVIWEECVSGDGYDPNEYFGLISKDGQPLL